MIAGLSAGVLSGCAGRQPAPVYSAPSQGYYPPPQSAESSPGGGLNAVIDISHTSAVTDFDAMRSAGILGVLHKATEGGDWADPLYAPRRVQARARGVLWGAYHFGTRQYSGAQQAAAFLAAAQPDRTTLLALDLEPNERRPFNTMTLDQAEEFVRTVAQATGRLPMVYVHPTWADGGSYGRGGQTLGRAIGPDSILASCDLWVVSYDEQPTVPYAWARRGWRLWQYAGDDYGGGGGPYGELSRTVPGVERCDRNLFHGNAAQLVQFWNAAPAAVS